MAAGHLQTFRRFHLFRSLDISGVSGTGIVAEGVQFSNGKVALTWLHDRSSVGLYDEISDLLHIHGHEGTTVVEWLDAESAA